MLKIQNYRFCRTLPAAVMIVFLLGLGSTLLAADTPKAKIEEMSYTFDEVLEGTVVKHTYTIHNTGKAPLVIKSVRTSCGCTTAKKPDSIQPGKKDEIVVEGNTRGYGGHRFQKTILVTTNDPEQEKITLKFEGPVARFAEITPQRISLRGNVEEDLSGQAVITPEPKYPFKVLSAEPDEELKDKIDIKIDKKDTSYTINIHNKVSEPTRYRGKIIIKTDSSLRPELELYVYAFIKAKSS